MLTDVAPRILGLRSTAARLFDSAALRGGDVELDFAGIEFMGRAFAHEYLRLKSGHPHAVAEVNVPDSVGKMFEVVRNARPPAPLLTEEEMRAAPILLVVDP